MMAPHRRVAAMLAPALAIALSAAADAREVTVRSGLHDGYTRLALDIAPGTGWSIAQDDGGALLRLDGAVEGFDTSGVFRRIDRRRIRALEARGPTELRIETACDCRIKAQLNGAAMLVIDVVGAPAVPVAAGAGTRLAPPLFALPRALARLSFGAAVTPGTPPAIAEPPAVRIGNDAVPSRALAPSAAPAPSPVSADSAIADALERRARVQAAQRELLDQLGRAASQGLLTPAARLRGDPGTGESESSLLAPGARSGLSARSSIDRAMADAIPNGADTERDEFCYGDGDLDIAAWSDGRGMVEQLGPLRSRLLDATDRPDAGAALALARLYLHFGFGAEAGLVLKDLAGEQPVHPVLPVMARIVDGAPLTAPDPLQEMLACDGAAALWAVLAHEKLGPEQMLDISAVLRSLDALPPHLRSHLAPTVSARLTEARRSGAAKSALRLMRRADPAETSPKSTMADARIELSRGAPAAARDHLHRLAESGGEQTPEALIALVETSRESGLDLPEGVETLIAGYAREYRDTEIGDALLGAQMLALGAEDRADEALEMWPAFAGRSNESISARLRDRLIRDLVGIPDDLRFLAVATRLGVDDPAGEEAMNMVAARLTALGFPGPARALLARPAEGEVALARRLLRAEIALSAGEPRDAEAELLGIAGPEADRLRARARSQSGDHAAAQQLFAALRDDHSARRAAWRAGDWAEVASTGEGTRAEAAALTLESGTAPAAEGEEGMLARGRALVQRSAGARATLDALVSGGGD